MDLKAPTLPTSQRRLCGGAFPVRGLKYVPALMPSLMCPWLTTSPWVPPQDGHFCSLSSRRAKTFLQSLHLNQSVVAILQRIERGIDQGPARAARRYGVVQSVAHDRSFRAALFAGERLFESFPHNQADRLIAGLQGDIVLDVPLQNIDL
jgi:hypothetical protein